MLVKKKPNNKIILYFIYSLVPLAAVGFFAQRFLPGFAFHDLVVVIGLCLLGIVLGVYYTTSRRMVSSIRDLDKATRQVEMGNFDVRVNVKTGDELEDLANAFNRTTAALRKIDKEHKELEGAKTRFLSITSHELRTPMTPMKAQLQMLEKGYFGKVTKRQKDALDIVIRNVTRLNHIITDLLDISRLEAARLKFDFKKVNLEDYAKDIMTSLKNFMPEKKITYVNKIGKLPVIECDPDRVGQVLRNLLTNATKFTPKNGKIIVSAAVKNNHIAFSVKDSGIGISSSNQDKIFEPFFQAEQTIYRKQGGTGLGLSICKGIIDSQKGKIWLTSKEGKGTTFYFTVPFKPVKDTKPIRVVFSVAKDIEKKVLDLFTDKLGPLGKKEYIELKKRGVTAESAREYFTNLKKSKIIDEKEYITSLDELRDIFKC